MGFTRGIGRTNTLQAVTRDVAGLAMDMRRDKRAVVEQQSVQELRNMEKQQLQMKMDEHNRANKLLPIDQYLSKMTPSVQAEVSRNLQASGMIEDVGGVQVIRAKNVASFYQNYMAPNAKQFGNLRMNDINTSLKETQGKMAEIKQGGKDISKDKNFLQLQEQEKELLQQRSEMLTVLDRASEMTELSKSYTKESIEAHMQDRSKPLEPLYEAKSTQGKIASDVSAKVLTKEQGDSAMTKANAITTAAGQDPAKVKMANFLMNKGIAKDAKEAWDMATEGVASVPKMATSIYTAMVKNNESLSKSQRLSNAEMKQLALETAQDFAGYRDAGEEEVTDVAIPDDAGKVKVEKDGQQFWLPEKQLSEAVKQGYKQVK